MNIKNYLNIDINLKSLTKEEQMLLNELYYFYSEYFNVSSFIPGKHFQTHF